MNLERLPPTPIFQTADAPARAVEVASGEDILEAMLQGLQGGEFHLQPKLAADGGEPFARYFEIGHALRRTLRDPRGHELLIARLRKNLDVLIGTLPASIRDAGLLPEFSQDEAGAFRSLAEIADEEIRQWLIAEAGLIYGELKRYELANFFAAIGPCLPPGAKMFDLGSGLGKVVLSAALCLPYARCLGVEILPYRHRLALERANDTLSLRARSIERLGRALARSETLRLPSGASVTMDHLLDVDSRLEFRQASMFDVDLHEADWVFLYSTCFAPLMPAIAEKLARELRQDALVSTTTVPLKHPAFVELKHFPAKTLAWTDVFIYQRTHGQDHHSPAPPAVLYQPDAAQWEAKVRSEIAASQR